MGTNTHADTTASDTNARIDTQTLATDRPTNTSTSVDSVPADRTDGSPGHPAWLPSTRTPYLGPYPMALLVRAFLFKGLNSWEDAALCDHLRAHPSLYRELGFETLPDQSTFWLAWNHRFSADLRNVLTRL